MAIGEKVNPSVLVWARESAGLDLKDAARQIGLTATREGTQESKLLEMEVGERLPSRAQLTSIAKVYRRPLITFYMSAPPPKADRGTDFRSTGSAISPRDNALLDSLLRDLKARQEMVRSLLEESDEGSSKPFVGSCSLADPASSVAGRISESLDIGPGKSDRGDGAEALFKKLRTNTERLGVFVLLVGDLGSHHSALSEEVFRGFALADDVAPFIVINDHDARTARSFTLIHELTHVFIGESGVSGSPETAKAGTHAGRVEEFCNDVAGLVLLPGQVVDQPPANWSKDSLAKAARFIEDTAKEWSVSEPLVAYRLRRNGWISPAVYHQLAQAYAQRWEAQKVKQKSANQVKEGGPSYYVVRQHRLGEGLLNLVRRNMREDRLTHTKAAKILGVKPGTVEALVRHFEKTPASLQVRGNR